MSLKCAKCGKEAFSSGSWYKKGRELRRKGDKLEVKNDPDELLCDECYDNLREEEQKRWRFFSKGPEIGKHKT